MSDEDKPPRDYEVGYGKPPKSGQFKKGQSGNPSGKRRKVARTSDQHQYDADWLRIADEEIELRTNGRLKKMTNHEALVRSSFIAGIKGNSYAQARITARLQVADTNMKRHYPEAAAMLRHRRQFVVNAQVPPADVDYYSIGRVGVEYAQEVWGRTYQQRPTMYRLLR